MASEDGRFTNPLNVKPKKAKPRANRNPVLGEKTPRDSKVWWEYRVPTGREEVSKWNYPETHGSLIDQLESVKGKVQMDLKRQKESDDRVAAFKETLKASQIVSARNTGRDSARGNYTGRESARGDQSARISARGYETERSDTFEYTNRTAGDEEEPQKSCRVGVSDFSIIPLKKLNDKNPEVLAKWRAERAAKYVNSLPRGLDMPENVDMEKRIAYRPNGTNVSSMTDKQLANRKYGPPKKYTKKQSARLEELNEAQLVDSVKQLTQKLNETNSEIERQELKIALSKKVKTYEKRKK